jgi:peptidoglycan lytic transglycosylase
MDTEQSGDLANRTRRQRTYAVAAGVIVVLATVGLATWNWGSLKQRRARNRRIVAAAAKKSGVSVALALAVAEAESGFDDRALSPKGAVGLMQVLPSTAKEVAARLKLSNYDLRAPDDNARIGLAYLGELSKRYRGDLHLALAAYNAGPRCVSRWRKQAGGGHPGSIVLKRCAYPSTRKYVARVLAARKRYQQAEKKKDAG